MPHLPPIPPKSKYPSLAESLAGIHQEMKISNYLLCNILHNDLVSNMKNDCALRIGPMMQEVKEYAEKIRGENDAE